MSEPMNARELLAQALLDLSVTRDGGKPFSIRDAGENTLHRHNSEADAILAAMPDIIRAMVVPLVWEKVNRHHYAGDYVLIKFKNGYLVDFKDRAIVCEVSIEEAKAAANTHNAAQFMKGLGIG